MGITVIDRLIDYSKSLIKAFKSNKKDKVLKLLNALEKENKEELNLAKEFKINYLLALHGYLENVITILRQNLNNANLCIEQLGEVIKRLDAIVDQRKVRDQLISEIIHPIMENWGYKKKARTFVKKEGKIIKKLNVYSSQWDDYYHVSFIFEISASGPNLNMLGERAEERWFELTEDTDIEKIKVEIEEHLIKVIKPFLDRIK